MRPTGRLMGILRFATANARVHHIVRGNHSTTPPSVTASVAARACASPAHHAPPAATTNVGDIFGVDEDEIPVTTVGRSNSTTVASSSSAPAAFADSLPRDAVFSGTISAYGVKDANATTGAASSDDGRVPSSPRGGRITGIVARWVERDGYGFIAPSNSDAAPTSTAAASTSGGIFVHIRDVVGGVGTNGRPPALVVGDAVEFSLERQPDGRPRARRVTMPGGANFAPLHAGSGAPGTSSPRARRAAFSAATPIESYDDVVPAAHSTTRHASPRPRTGTGRPSDVTITRTRSVASAAAEWVFPSRTWNFLERGNPAIEGFKHTRFPPPLDVSEAEPPTISTMVAAASSSPAAPTTAQQRHAPGSSGAANTSSNSSSHVVVGVTPAGMSGAAPSHRPTMPSSRARPLREADLTWPALFRTRELERFDMEELEDRRSGWVSSTRIVHSSSATTLATVESVVTPVTTAPQRNVATR